MHKSICASVCLSICPFILSSSNQIHPSIRQFVCPSSLLVRACVHAHIIMYTTHRTQTSQTYENTHVYLSVRTTRLHVNKSIHTRSHAIYTDVHLHGHMHRHRTHMQTHANTCKHTRSEAIMYTHTYKSART